MVPESFDASSDEPLEHLFLIMQLLDTDMHSVLKNAGEIGFSEEHMIITLYNSLCALNFLHTANVMHRDIKPANILMDDNCRIFICDFGLARTCTKALYPNMDEYVMD